MSKDKVAFFAKSLFAVLAGNIVYFLLNPALPPALQHEPLRPDLGLMVDFLICLGIYLLLLYFPRRHVSKGPDSALPRH